MSVQRLTGKLIQSGSRAIFKNFVQKPECEMLVNYSKLQAGSRNMDYIFQKASMSPELYEANLGTTALQISEINRNGAKKAQEQISKIFNKNVAGVVDINFRPKGAISNKTKLERGIKDGIVTDFSSAVRCIIDGEGSRIIIEDLPKLSSSELKSMINNFKINGEIITPRQRRLLTKYVYNNPMSEMERQEAYPLYEKFANPLIEKRSQGVADALTLSFTKYRINKGELTIAEIREKGLMREDLIKRLETENIEGLKLKLLNNYRGMYGLPEFSNRQVNDIRKIAGEDVIINTRQDILDYNRHPGFNYAKKEKKYYAIKDTGYRTTQMDVIHSNGTRGEIQIKGAHTCSFGERQHIPYDLMLEKQTVNSMFNDYRKVYKYLKPHQQKKYNHYFENCFDYYNRIELGLPAKQPKLPKGLKEILSDKSLESLYLKNEQRLAELKQDFVPHFREIAIA